MHTFREWTYFQTLLQRLALRCVVEFHFGNVKRRVTPVSFWKVQFDVLAVVEHSGHSVRTLVSFLQFIGASLMAAPPVRGV